MQAALVHRKVVGKLVFVAVFLNLQIRLGVLQFLFDWDQLMPAADADAEQLCQSIDHLHGILTPFFLAEPPDGIQRII